MVLAAIIIKRKKKIYEKNNFLFTNYGAGGVEKELLTILPHFPKNEYSVSVLIMYDTDKEISGQVSEKGAELINLNIDDKYYCSSTKDVVRQRLQRGHLAEAIKVLVLQGLKIGYTGSAISLKDIPSLSEHYDIAVCYHMHSQISVAYVAEKINADTKYLWMHNDFSSTGFEPRRIKKFLSMYKCFVGCSEKVTNEFAEAIPEYANKAITVHNIIDVDEAKKMAIESIDDIRFSQRHGHTLVTIGRYVPQKGYEDAIKAGRILLDMGVDFSWYAIGFGTEEEKLKKMILEFGLKERFFLLGKKANPYPYLKDCDIYVQPSRHEGFGLTVAEARIFNKPIVSTDFAGIREQIIDGVTGTIVPVGDPCEMAKKIYELMQNKELRAKYSDNLAKEANQTGKYLQDLLTLF